MELDELKIAWRALDRRLDRLTLQALDRQRETRMQAAQQYLRSLARGQVLQIVAGAMLCLLFAPYWVAHWQVLHLAVYGLLLHGYGLMFIAFAVRALVLIHRLDYSAPVMTIQKQLADLAHWRLRVEGPAFALVGCFLWIPLTLVAFRAVGADLWVQAPEVVYSFIASGFVCLAIGMFALRAIRRLDDKPQSPGWAIALRNSTVGRGIRLAQRQLDEVNRFEQE